MKTKLLWIGNGCVWQSNVTRVVCGLLVLLMCVTHGTGCGESPGESKLAEASPPPGPGVDMALGSSPPFEWMGVYTFPQGTVDLVIQPGPDESMDIALVAVPSLNPAGLDETVQLAKRVASGQAKPTVPGTTISPGSTFYQLHVGGTEEMRFPVSVNAAGKYALFTQHFADEFQTLFQNKSNKVGVEAQRIFKERFGQIVILPEAVQKFGVQLAAAKTYALAPSFTVPARVAFNAERVAQVASAVSGRVTELKVRQGDTVKQGDLLIVVDSPELGEAQSDFLQRRTIISTATPAVELAQGAYDRAKSLYDKNQGIALSEVQKRLAELQESQATLRIAQSNLTAAENKLHLLGMTQDAVQSLAGSGEVVPKYLIRAPISGQVTRRDVTLGELVRPDRESLMVLADLTMLWVLAEVPEAKLAEVAVGSPATITLAAIKDEKFEGIVSYISPELDPSTRTARVRIEVKNDSGRLKPGMFAQAEISQPKSAATQAVLAVPDAAVQTIEGKPVVFVPLNDRPSTFLKRPVTLESSIGALWPVRYGLTEGEMIVTDASFVLKAELGKSSAKHDH